MDDKLRKELKANGVDPDDPKIIARYAAMESMFNELGIQISSQEEIDDAAVKGDMTFMCIPCTKGQPGIPGSTKAMCGKCGQDVWMSPATKQSHPLEANIRCVPCVTKELEEKKND